MYCFIALFMLLFMGEPLFALHENYIVAGPVPFNPNRQVLNILYEPGAPAHIDPDQLKVEIFDINGDLVFEGQRSGGTVLPFTWSGRNMGGRMVHPGMYIIKLTVENTGTGAFGRRIIRIVVAR